MRIQLSHTFEEIISVENLLEAWQEFIKGKRTKQDVLEFQMHLIDEVQLLHTELLNKEYKHGAYTPFNISDPKPRNIHKASVRDRLLHHAIHRKLYPFFDRAFIFDSYSCRKDKGTHKALDRCTSFGKQVSRNNTRTCWVLKCDIRKFFASIDHEILTHILETYIPDKNILWLLYKVIDSFHTQPGIGLPLGNLTSQLFVNVYMNEFDQFMKHKIKANYYIRYADDFVICSQDKDWLQRILSEVRIFLLERLKLQLHPRKVSLRTLASGIDFLGWIHFPSHRILRTTTRHRLMKKMKSGPNKKVIDSYFGLLQHGDTYVMRKQIAELYSFDQDPPPTPSPFPLYTKKQPHVG